MKTITLTADEQRAVTLPADARLHVMMRNLARPTAEVLLDVESRVEVRSALDGAAGVYIDATEHGLRLTPASDCPVAEPQSDDVRVGQCFNARLVAAVLDALPPGPVLLVWRRRLDPLTLHAVEGPPGWRDAVVMPVRACTPSEAGHQPRPGCVCRDCTAGRRWGW